MKANCQLSSYKEMPSLFLFLLEQRGEIKHTNTHIIYIAKAKGQSKINANCASKAHTQTHKYLQSWKPSELWIKLRCELKGSNLPPLWAADTSSMSLSAHRSLPQMFLTLKEFSCGGGNAPPYIQVLQVMGPKKKKNEKKNKEGILLKSSDEFWCESITLRLC